MGLKVIEDNKGKIKVVSDGIIKKSKGIGKMLMFKKREKGTLIEDIQIKVYDIVSYMMGK